MKTEIGGPGVRVVVRKGTVRGGSNPDPFRLSGAITFRGCGLFPLYTE